MGLTVVIVELTVISVGLTLLSMGLTQWKSIALSAVNIKKDKETKFPAWNRQVLTELLLCQFGTKWASIIHVFIASLKFKSWTSAWQSTCTTCQRNMCWIPVTWWWRPCPVWWSQWQCRRDSRSVAFAAVQRCFPTLMTNGIWKHAQGIVCLCCFF